MTAETGRAFPFPGVRPTARETCEAHARGDLVDRAVSALGEALDAALEARAIA